MNDKYYLNEDGKERLKKDLEASEEPLKMIESLQECDHFDFKNYSNVFRVADISGFDASEIFEEYIEKQKNELISKLKEMSPEGLTKMFILLKPYTMIPAFHDVIKYAVDKCKIVPSWFKLPDDLKVELTPADRLKVFQNNPSEFEEFLRVSFKESMCDFEDTDDFSYNKLFNNIAQYCFQNINLHYMTVKFCESNFFIDYHPMYSVIRFKLALYNSPLAKVDPARPLSILVLKAINGKPDFQTLRTAAEISPSISQIILSIPSFTMLYQMRSYILAFGVTPKLKDKWTKYLTTGNEEAVEYMKSEPFFARVIAINAAQDTIINQNLFETLEFCSPQVDINYIMCRNYKSKYESILIKWASINGSCLIDYMTSCLSRGVQIPTELLQSLPPLTELQQQIVDYVKSKQ